MYYIDAKGNYASYINGVTFSKEIQQNWASRTPENKRLSTTSSQEDYFEKQKLMQEAIAQLKQNGSVSAKIAKEVDVEALKNSMESAQEGQASALSMLGQGGESQEAAKNSVLDSKAIPNPLTLDEEAQNTQRLEALDKIAYEANKAKEKAKEKEEIKQDIKESITSENQESTTTTSTTASTSATTSATTSMGAFFEKTLVQTSANAPQNVSEEVKGAYNPLELKEGQSAGENAVSFIDEVSGKKIALPLSEENAAKLSEKFGSLEAASEYVKGWYYDAAYGMGYLSGDFNGDGSISLEEGIHLKSLVSLKDGQYHSIAEQISGGAESQMKFLEKVGFIDNLGDYINHSISQDSNLDGALNLNEIMGDKNELVLFKTGGESKSVDVFVIQKFSFEIENIEESLNDILLNLGAKEESKVENKEDSKEDSKGDSKREQSEVSTSKEKIQEWLEVARELKDADYLESLEEYQRENLLKSDRILTNFLESA